MTRSWPSKEQAQRFYRDWDFRNQSFPYLTLLLALGCTAAVFMVGWLRHSSLPHNQTVVLLWIAAFILTIPLHELLHVLGVYVGGGRPPTVRVRWFDGARQDPMSRVDVRGTFSRNRMVVTALAPLVAIDAFGLLAIILEPSWIWMAPAIVLNTAASSNDILQARWYLLFPRRALIEWGDQIIVRDPGSK
jgi:hypothetical protein